MLISMSDIYSYVEGHLTPSTSKRRPCQEGEQLYLADHIINCGYEGEGPTIAAFCLASTLSADCHKITLLFVDPSDFRTWDCSCTCKAGSSEKCKHIVASLFFVYNAVGLSRLSCTEITQTWGKRKKVSDLTAAKSLGEFCHVLDVEPEEIDPSLVEELFMGSLTAVPDSEVTVHLNLRKPQAKQDMAQLDIREDKLAIIYMNSLRSRITQILYEEDLHKPLNACCIETFNAHYPCDALEVCKRTIENHSAWMEARKLRITGTRCYSLYTFAKGNWAKKALEYFRAEPFKGNWATRYGEAQEASAREAYRFFIREWGEVQKYGVAICQSNP